MPKISGIEAIVPNSIDYKMIKKSLIKGTRRTVRLNPANEVNNFNYNSNRIIKFNIPANTFLDLQNTNFQFIAQGSSSLSNQVISFTASLTLGLVLNVTAVTSGTLYVGMTVTGASVLPGTTIVSFGTGSGGIGTYNTSLGATVASEAMTGNTAQIAFNNHIECIVNRLEIFAGDGNTQIESLHQYNINSASKVKYMYSDNYAANIGHVNEGYFTGVNSLAIRQSQCQVQQGYAVNFIASGIFQNDIKYLPLALMSGLAGYSRSMVIEITLENPLMCMVSTAPADVLNYSVSQAYMNLELIEMPELEMKLMNDVRNGMVMAIPYLTTDLWTNQVNTSGETVVSWAEYKEYLQTIRTIFSPPKVNNTTSFTYDWMRPDINNYQYKVKDTWYPTLPIQMTLQAGQDSNATQYTELLKVFDMMKKYQHGNQVDQVTSSSTDFMIAQTFQTFYNDKCYMINAGEYWLDGVDTSDASQVVFRMYLNSAPNNITIYSYFDFVGALVFDSQKMNVIK